MGVLLLTNQVFKNIGWLHFFTILLVMNIFINSLLNINLALQTKNKEMKSAYELVGVLSLFALVVQFFIGITM